MSSLGQRTAMPSAIVRAPAGTATGLPSRSDPTIDAQRSACTPMTRTPGRRWASAAAVPPIRPPPPMATTTTSTSGASAAISSPTVACPATMSGWSNGGTNNAPRSFAPSLAAAIASSTLSPASTMAAPYDLVASTLGNGALAGM